MWGISVITWHLYCFFWLTYSIRICHACLGEPSCVTSRSEQTPLLPFISNKKQNFEDLKKIWVEVKKSLSSFIYFCFQMSSNNTKNIILTLLLYVIFVSRLCKLVLYYSIPSKTGVWISLTISRISASASLKSISSTACHWSSWSVICNTNWKFEYNLNNWIQFKIQIQAFES